MRAVTRPLAAVTDATPALEDVARGDGALFVREGVGVAGRGIAARVPAASATAWLAALRHDDGIGHAVAGPVAIGALPFADPASGTLAVPACVVGTAPDGTRWITAIGEDPDLERLAAEAVAPADAATGDALDARYSVAPGTPVADYLAAVAAARDEVRAGRLAKVVVARDVVVRASAAIDVHAVLRRLRAAFATSHRYSVDGLVGASPELLVSVFGRDVASHPLAGTAPRTGDPDTDARLARELVASTKDQIEHRVVIEMVHDTLLPWCSYLDWEPEPSIVTVANVQHLGTRVAGVLSDPPAPVVDLAIALCPTPALGGSPREAALRLIARLESRPRGRYGGAVGWVDGRGQGAFAVTIRCAELSDDRREARLFAGGGIVADSDPHAELAETRAKFQAMLAAIVRP
ncbi:MAG: isochorismate synthase [Ilumatobacteraceae bacterium]